MPRSILTAALLLAVPALASLAGCTSDLTQATGISQTRRLTQVPPQLPYAGRCEMGFAYTSATTIQVTSVCQLRGIGRVTGVTQQTMDFSQVAQTGLIGITNTSVYTAPNGDQLFATFIGTGSQLPGSVNFVGVETYIGGTGRFSNAGGSSDLIGSADLATSAGFYTTTERTVVSVGAAFPFEVAVIDPTLDHTGPIDVVAMDLRFDNVSGSYKLEITASPNAPFMGDFRINISLYNPDAGTVFSDVVNDYSLTQSLTRITLTGNSTALYSWAAGNRVYTNSLSGTPNPPGTTLFRSSVSSLPFGGFLANEDYIAFADRAQPAHVESAISN